MTIIEHPSPNFSTTKAPRDPWCIIIHATATKGLESPLEWLCNPESKVSAHYLLGREGEIFRLVDEENVAWHAGVSSWRGTKHVNDFSIGIELVNPNDGITLYAEDQLKACAELVTDICKRRGIEMDDIVGHKDIAPGRKNDPAGFPWGDFKAQLAAAGIR